MRLSAIRNAAHRTKTPSRTRLATFWLGFAVLLVLTTLAFATSVKRSWAEGAQHADPGVSRQQGDGPLAVSADQATDASPPTAEATSVNAPANTPLAPQVPTISGNAVDSLNPGATSPGATTVPLQVDAPSAVPEQPTDVLPPTGGATDTPVPLPVDPTPDLPSVTSEPVVTASSEPVVTPILPTQPPADPTTAVPPTEVTEPPTSTTAPAATASTQPTLPSTAVTDLPGMTDTPGVIDPPVMTNTPGVIDTPPITHSAGVTDIPGVIPGITVTPRITPTPDATRTPVPTNIGSTTPTEDQPLPTSTPYLQPIYFTPQSPRGTNTPKPTAPMTSTSDVIINITVQPTATTVYLPTPTSIVIPLITFTPLPTPTPNFVPTSALIPSATLLAHETIAAIGSTATAASDTARNPSSSPIEVATAFSDRATAESALATVMPVNTPYVDPSLPIFERAVTATLAVDAGAPILVYTYTQKINPNGEHIIAACIWNIGTAAATDIDVQFDARAPAIFTAVRIPSEQSELDDRQVKVRIASLTPKMLKQIEVVVMRVDAPLPQWVSVAIPQAYALNHPDDPAPPDLCTSSGIDAVASTSREVEIAVGGRYDLVNPPVEAEQKRDEDPQLLSVAIRDQGPPSFSSFVLYCVIGLILATLLVITLLSSERNKRRKPPRQRQRLSA